MSRISSGEPATSSLPIAQLDDLEVGVGIVLVVVLLLRIEVLR